MKVNIRQRESWEVSLPPILSCCSLVAWLRMTNIWKHPHTNGIYGSSPSPWVPSPASNRPSWFYPTLKMLTKVDDFHPFNKSLWAPHGNVTSENSTWNKPVRTRGGPAWRQVESEGQRLGLAHRAHTMAAVVAPPSCLIA